MKKIWIVVPLIAVVFIACNNAAEINGETSKKDKRVSSRNYGINRSNSYSGLFLDSATVEKIIGEKKIPDSIAWRVRSFYNTRNYQFAWFSSDGLTEQARGFWNLLNNYISSTDDTTLNNKSLKKRMDKLISEESLSPSSNNKTYITTEVELTSQFIRHTLQTYDRNYVKRKEMERFVPFQKRDALEYADSLVSKKHKDDKYYEDINLTYGLLKDQLALYTDIQKKGGWPIIQAKKKLYKKGITAPEIVTIKKRLQLTGDIATADTTKVFDSTLQNGVRHFQQRHGLKTDGIINETTLKEMNVPVLHRVQQLLINMDRMRWLPSQPNGNLIVVNIPEFKLYVMEGKQRIFDMNVVVGKDGHDTRIFTGNLNQVVFSPYWNVPPSIVEKEIIPAMEKNPHYLEKENMEITGEEDGLPVVRQLPGEKNALGKVKFLFPNSFNIYFHDTPSKSLFASDKRAFSHGCIRLSEPKKMAEYLLRDDPKWSESKIEKAMNSGEEKFVKLKKPVPVIIAYYTAWVDENGLLNFREDIYGHDASLYQKMFTKVY